MHCYKWITAAMFMLVFVACNNPKDVTDEKRKEVMDLHDREMAKMDYLMSLKENLASIKDSSLPDVNQKLEHQIKLLEEADEAMMNWMRNYKEPSESASEEEKQKYYEEQLAKMKSVEQIMKQSINSARVTIGQHKK